MSVEVTQIVDVVPMNASHLEEIYEIEVLSFAVPWSKRAFRKELENPLSMSYTLSLPLATGKKVVGYSFNWLTQDEFHILNLAVHPLQRRKGYGRRRLEYSLRRAAERGATRGFLEVRRSNSSAIELYRALGFKTVGVRPRYYSNNHEDAFVMRLDLPAVSLPWNAGSAP